MVVGGPKHDYLDPTIDALKKYVQDGGRLILSFDAGIESAGSKDGRHAETGRAGDEWGMTPKGDVILDLSSASRFSVSYRRWRNL